MTEQEKDCLEALAMAWNLFLELPTEHSDDVDDFRKGIHVLQRQIMARPTRRDMNDRT